MRPGIIPGPANPGDAAAAESACAAFGQNPLPVHQIVMVRAAKAENGAPALREDRLVAPGRRLAGHPADLVAGTSELLCQSRGFLRSQNAERIRLQRQFTFERDAVQRDGVFAVLR